MKLRIPYRHRRFISSLGVATLAIFVLPELEAKPPTADKARDSALLSFITIPDKVLPKHVRIKKRVRSASILPVRHNPEIIADPQRLSFVAKFFGVDEKAELKSIIVGAVAVYQNDETAKEIGIYAISYSDQKSADERFNKLLTRPKQSKVKGRVFPFIQQGRLLLYAWNDSDVGDHDFKAILKYLQTKRFNHQD